jgi:structural maintenance of chromosomes protein 6
MEASLFEVKAQIEGFKATIAAEEQRIHNQEKQAETRQKLEEAKQAKSSMEVELKGLNESIRAATNDRDTLYNDGMAMETNLKELQNRIAQLDGTIRRCDELSKDNLAAYGNNIAGVWDSVKRMRWHGQAPFGPLGVHVKVKDPKKWGELLRIQLGKHMITWVITDSRDRNQLKKLLMDSGK